MSNSIHWMTLALVSACIFITSCNSSTSIDKDDCISNYAQKGRTDRIVAWGYQLCNIAADDNKLTRDRAYALCAVRKIPSTRTTFAFEQIIRECREKFPRGKFSNK